MKYINTYLFYFMFLNILLNNFKLNAQNTLKKTNLNYFKHSSSNIKIDDGYKAIFIISKLKNQSFKDSIHIKLNLNKLTVSIKTKIEASTNTITGELPIKLFNSRIKGHIEFAKEMLYELEKNKTDSIIKIFTYIVEDSTIQGILNLDFKNCCKTSKKFWNEVKYYHLLEKQMITEDSIDKLSAVVKRSTALEQVSKKKLNMLSDLIKDGKEEISAKFVQFEKQFDHLNTINNDINESFVKMRSGQYLTEQEKQKIAKLTKERNEIKKEIEKNKKGKEALDIYNKTSRTNSIYRNSKQQYAMTLNQLNYSKQRLMFFSKEALRIKNKLSVLEKLLK